MTIVSFVGRRRSAALVAVVVALIATSCSPGPSADGAIANASIRNDSIGELDRICIDGVDTTADLGNLELLMTADGLDEPVSLMIYQSGGVLYSPLPLHPTTPGEGGTVEIELVDGDDRTGTMTVELSAIPNASGAWQETIGLLRAGLEARAQDSGTTLDAVSTTSFDTVSNELLPIKMILTYIDDELDGLLNAPSNALDEQGQALVEATIAKLELSQLIPGVVEQSTPDAGIDDCVDGGVAPEAMESETRVTAMRSGLPAAPTVNRADSSSSIMPSGATGVRAAAAGGTCRVFELEIANGAQLADAVETGIDAVVHEGGAEEQVLQDIDSLTSVLENLPAEYGDAISLIGTMFATITLWFQMDAAVYPTQLTSIDAAASITSFNEDFKVDGAVTQAVVTAAATGFNGSEAFAKIAAEMAETILGSAVGAAAGAAGEEIEAGFALFLGGKVRKAILESLIDQYGSEYLEYCPRTWDVDITDADYIDISAVIGRIAVDKESLTYWPVELHEDILRVRARSDVFSGLTAQTDIDVDTKRLRVIARPEEIWVERPGEIVNITVEIDNADTTTLFWNTPQGSWDDGIGADTNDGRTRPLKTPTSTDAYPFVIEIRSTSDTGLREGKGESDPRADSVTVRLKDLIVKPDPGTVLVRGVLEFLATDSEGEPQNVTWTATGGTIESQDFDNVVTGAGHYTAGDEPGLYTVTATKADGSGIFDTVEVEVIEACNPLGTWRVREQDFLDQVTALGGGVTFTHKSGAYYVVFEGDRDGGRFVSDRDAWAFIGRTADGALLMTISGTEVGTWTFNEALLEIETESSDVTVDVAIEIGGSFQTLPGGASLAATTGPSFASAPVTCSGTTMETTVTDATGSITVRLDKIN